MEKFIIAAGIPVRIATQGDTLPAHSAVLLLHGYLESLEVWDSLARQLGKHRYTLALDLPGHGLSGTHPDANTMELMADVLSDACRQLGVQKACVVGHSMGGYVALALAKKYPALVEKLCLLHSTPNPDSPEKKLQRNREIALIAAGKKEPLVAQSLYLIFAEDNESKHYEAIAELEANALLADDAGIVACLRGMQQREDMNDFLASFDKPLLFVFGKKDRHIAWEAAQGFIQRFPQAQTLVLENSGHAGFIEEEEKVVEGLMGFVEGDKNLHVVP
ncbi:MAG: alpha/beta hydrolase [Prevotellaceae bacterium]|jgi:pimeloyl-ACP methyl ester carboxylesterase|nr:alpha/beta hydrolase [Prevotellaceae bacterium]